MVEKDGTASGTTTRYVKYNDLFHTEETDEKEPYEQRLPYKYLKLQGRWRNRRNKLTDTWLTRQNYSSLRRKDSPVPNQLLSFDIAFADHKTIIFTSRQCKIIKRRPGGVFLNENLTIAPLVREYLPRATRIVSNAAMADMPGRHT